MFEQKYKSKNFLFVFSNQTLGHPTEIAIFFLLSLVYSELTIAQNI